MLPAEKMEGIVSKQIVSVLAAALRSRSPSLATARSAQTKWDMPTPYPDGNFHTENVMQFAADVDKATDGTLKITVHSAGSLIKHPRSSARCGQGRRRSAKF